MIFDFTGLKCGKAICIKGFDIYGYPLNIGDIVDYEVISKSTMLVIGMPLSTEISGLYLVDLVYWRNQKIDAVLNS